MTEMKLNKDAFSKAEDLIKKHQYDKESDWSEAQPSAADENDFLEEHNWAEYGRWFLAIDSDASEETKDRYNFPYGDFRRVHRDALIAAKQRAAQYEHDEIEQAADDLLQLMDETMSGGK